MYINIFRRKLAMVVVKCDEIVKKAGESKLLIARFTPYSIICYCNLRRENLETIFKELFALLNESLRSKLEKLNL